MKKLLKKYIFLFYNLINKFLFNLNYSNKYLNDTNYTIILHYQKNQFNDKSLEKERVKSLSNSH